MAHERPRTSRWTRILLCAAAAMLPVAGAQPAAVAAPTAWNLVWSDDFTGAAGGAPDAGKWGFLTGGNGFGNQEREFYTAGRNNSFLDGGGNLVIEARKDDAAQHQCWYGTCQFTSARLTSQGKFSQARGRFEARIKIPRGQGVWPAFWALGTNINTVGWPACGEIDTMENIGREPNQVHGSLHGPNGYNTSSTFSLGEPFANGFHVFAVDWFPDHISFEVDGKIYNTQNRPAAGWAFDHPFYLVLNLAIGGSWPGSPNGSTPFPSMMDVDYVHVFTAS